MRDYELTFIVRILPSDEEVNQAIDQVISYIELGDNGVVKSVDRKIFGRRRLAYLIDGQREGHFVFIKAAILPDHIIELETELKALSTPSCAICWCAKKAKSNKVRIG